MGKQKIRFGIIGCGLMGKELASAVARWRHLQNLDFEPQIVAACDTNSLATRWFSDNISELEMATTDYHALLAHPSVDAVYCAVPHNVHQEIYCDIISAGKHLLGEKPFGINLQANSVILEAVNAHPELLVRCTSQFPFFPGAYRLYQWLSENRFGEIIEVEAGFWHSSDLDPNKPINWKRMIAINGEYGCMGDLGMHILHIPLRMGWFPQKVTAYLSKIIKDRPDGKGHLVPCETWDNAILGCKVALQGQEFPMFLSTKRIAPGHANSWFLKIYGTSLSAEFSTKNPKQLVYMPYTAGGLQEWHNTDVPYKSAYTAITGGIFEFGFSDSIQQMFASFCDEVAHGQSNMGQPLYCVTPEETALSHRLFTAALESQQKGTMVDLS